MQTTPDPATKRGYVPDWRRVLDDLGQSVAIASAVRDGRGGVVGLRVEYLNESAGGGNGHDMRGRSLAEAIPRGVWEACGDEILRVADTGEPLRRAVPAAGGAAVSLHVRPHEGGVIATWEEAPRPAAGDVRALADEIPVMIWTSGLKKEGVSFNRAWLKFTGRPLEDQLGDGWLELVHPDDRADLFSTCTGAFERREAFEVEFRLLRADGTYRWVFERGTPRLNGAGEFAGFIGSCVDIHERKRAQEALRASEGRYRAIVESQSEMICRFRLDGTILFANSAYARARGTTAAALESSNFWEFVEPGDREAVRSELERLSPETPRVRIENGFETPGGTRWTLWTNEALSFDMAGRPLEVQSTGIDITGRKRSERALELRFRQLRTIYRLSAAISCAAATEQIIETALEGLLEAAGADRASVLLFDDDGVMRFKGWRRLSERYRASIEGHTPWRPEDADARPIVVEDAQSDPALGELRETVLREGIRSLAFIPLTFAGRVLGKFMVYYDQPRRFSEEDIELCQTIAGHIAYAIERTRGEEALRESESRQRALSARLDLLLRSTSRLIETLETAELLPSLLDLSREVVGADGFAVWRRDEGGTWSIVSSRGLSEEYLRETIPSAGQDAPSAALIVQPGDLEQRATPGLEGRWERYEREGIRSLMVLPLRIRGMLSGTLAFYCRERHEFSELEVESARALANIASAAITTSELYAEESRQRRLAEEAAVRERFVAEAGALLSESLDYERTLSNVARAAVPGFADWCAVDLVGEGGVLQRLAVAHVDAEKVALAHELHERYPPSERSGAGALHVVETGEPEMQSEISDELLVRGARDEAHLRILRELEPRSYICVPLTVDGAVRGAITFATAESGRRFEERDLLVAEEIARRAAQAIANAQLYHERWESEQRLLLAVEAGRLGSWEWSVASGRVRWSAGLEAIHGLEPGVFGGTFEDFQRDIHPEDREVVSRSIACAMESGDDLTTEYRIVRPDGAVRWVEGRGKVSRDGSGAPVRVVGVCRDVTERKQAEEVRARLAAIVESTSDAVVGKTLDGIITSWNGGAERLFGYSAGEAVGRHTDLIIPAELRDQERELLARLDRGERVEHFETVRLTRDGRRLEVSLTISPIRDGVGRVVGASKVARDISERKRAEAALRESESQLRLALRGARAGAWVLDVASGETFWSEELRSLYGFGAGTAPSYGRWLDRIHPDDRARVEREFRERLESCDGEFDLEFRVNHPSNGERWISALGRIERDADGGAVRLDGINIDITERKRHEEQMRTVMAELNHRVKNTLAVVGTIAAQTVRTAGDLESFRTSFEERLRSIASAHKLLTSSEWEGAALSEIVATELDASAGEAQQRSVCGPAVVLPPKAALAVHMVIHELTTNACKYGALSDGGGRIDIRWSLAPGRRVELEWLERCERTIEPPAEMGYGSRLIEQLIEYDLTGEIQREFTPKGLRYEISFPLEPGQPAPLVAGGEEAEDADSGELARPTLGRVLIVEDNAALAMGLHREVEDSGYAVVGPAPTLARAMELARAGGFDGALIDVDLGGTPSYPLARLLAERGVPYVLLTGYNRGDLPADFGDAPVINKPLVASELAAFLERHCRRTAGA